jgi:hypothetical protein
MIVDQTPSKSVWNEGDLYFFRRELDVHPITRIADVTNV